MRQFIMSGGSWQWRKLSLKGCKTFNFSHSKDSFPERQQGSDQFFFQASSKIPLTTAIQP